MNENIIEIIAIINFNKENYCIYQKNGNIGYAIFCNGELKFNIDIKEKETLNQFYNLIRYDNNYGVFCGNYTIKSNEFEIYQDRRSNLYTFILKKNNKRYMPSKEDTILLNSYFNDEKFIYYVENDKDSQNSNVNKKGKPLKFIRRVLKVGAITAVALIATTILTYNLPQNVKCDIRYGASNFLNSDLTKKSKNYTFEDIEIALDANNNISEKEKAFIKEVLEPEFEENREYMDIELILRRLATLRIKYDKYYTYNEKTGTYQLTHEPNGLRSWWAMYNSLTNTTICLEPQYTELEAEERKNNPFGFDEVVKSIYFHEINHLLSNYEFDSILAQLSQSSQFLEYNDYLKIDSGVLKNIFDDIQMNLDSDFFLETIDEIFAHEYVDKYYNRTHDKNRTTAYSDKLPYMYCLVEILPPNVLREYKFSNNEAVMLKGLLDISDNKEEAYKLLTSLKSIYLYENLINQANNNGNSDEHNGNEEESIKSEETEEVKQLKKEQAENFRRIYDGFSYFYKAKYNKDMSNDMNMLMYLYCTPVLTDEERGKVENFLNNPKEVPSIVSKGYFAKDFIERQPNIEVKCLDNNSQEYTISIDENNRYLNEPDVNR